MLLAQTVSHRVTMGRRIREERDLTPLSLKGPGESSQRADKTEEQKEAITATVTSMTPGLSVLSLLLFPRGRRSKYNGGTNLSSCHVGADLELQTESW